MLSGVTNNFTTTYSKSACLYTVPHKFRLPRLHRES